MKASPTAKSTAALRELLTLAKEGDQEAFATLLSRYTSLLESRLYRIRTPNMTEEDVKDLRQEAYLSFYRALMHYDLDQTAVEFGLYAGICVDNGLCSALRSMKHLHRAPILPLDEMEAPVADPGADPSEHWIEQEKFNQLYALIERTLSPMENRVWRMYVTGQTATAIAAALGKDEKSVYNAIYRIRKKLREALNG